jgi:hypothetical protein
MSSFEDVRLTANSYGVDVQFRMQCPECNASEKAFAAVLTADGKIKYKCHRAKCGIAGVIETVLDHTNIQASESREPAPRVMNLRGLTDEEFRDLRGRWGLSYDDVVYSGFQWDEESDRLALPIKGPSGQLRGFVLRTLGRFTKPKVLTVKLVKNEPLIHWEGRNLTAPILLVEDLLSAKRASHFGVQAVSLLGTHISEKALEEISANNSNEELIIALDEDASVKALEYQQDLGIYFTRVKVVLLEKDIKDMTDAEVRACLSAI